MKSNLIAPHQEEFARTAREYEGLWHGTGTGKTRTALHTVREHSGSILVIAPKTTVHKKQWQYEASVLGIKEPVVISKEQFRRDHKILPKYDAIIGDEAHHLFGVSPNTRQLNKKKIPKTSQLFDSVLWYITQHEPKRVILATATPNKTPMSIYAACVLLGWEIEFYAFREAFYFVLPMDLSWGQQAFAPKRDEESIQKIANLTRQIGQVLRLDDIKDVPPQVFINEEFPLTDAQKKAIRDLPTMFTDEGAQRQKRHQIENGILYRKKFNPLTKKIDDIVDHFPCEKNDYILDRADEFKKMVIFARYTAQINVLADLLKKDGKKVLIMDSRTKDRKAIEQEAEASDSAYIIAQSGVSSEWEFKSSPVVIFASKSNKNLDYIQGKGRVQRYDRVKKNIYIDLITGGAGSVDKKLHDTIMSGKDFNEALFE